MAEPIPYPKWLYHHESGRSIVVDTPAQEAEQKKEGGWKDHPPLPPEPDSPVTVATEAPVVEEPEPEPEPEPDPEPKPKKSAKR